jgi:hypothetical protein
VAASRRALSLAPGQLADERVPQRAGVEVERRRVGRLEPLEQRLGGQEPAAAGRLLDARALVDLVAQRGDLQAPRRRDAAHVERRAPVHAGVDAPVAVERRRGPADRPRRPDRRPGAPEIDPTWSARKNALTPSPACLPTMPVSPRIASSIAVFSSTMCSK